MNIVEYSDEYAEAVKDLFVELQSYLAGLDKRGVIVLKDGYRDDYFHYVSEEIKKHRGKIFLAEENNAAVGCIVCKIFQGGGEDDITTSSRIYRRFGGNASKARARNRKRPIVTRRKIFCEKRLRLYAA